MVERGGYEGEGPEESGGGTRLCKLVEYCTFGDRQQSSAVKSFVNRRGLGRMRHLEIRDIWLQKEVRDGNVEVARIK